jgi:hypothetical protein
MTEPAYFEIVSPADPPNATRGRAAQCNQFAA